MLKIIKSFALIWFTLNSYQMVSIITIKCLKKIIRNKYVLNTYMIIVFFIKFILYKNAHDRTIFIFLNIIIFLKIGCANLDAAPISPLLPY